MREVCVVLVFNFCGYFQYLMTAVEMSKDELEAKPNVKQILTGIIKLVIALSLRVLLANNFAHLSVT